MWDQLCEVLTDFDFLHAKLGCAGGRLQDPPPGTVYDLLRDYLDALAVGALPAQHPRRGEVGLLYRALDENAHTLKEDRTRLVQEVANAWDWAGTALDQKVREIEQGCPWPLFKVVRRRTALLPVGCR
jgi:hypothetical protein